MAIEKELLDQLLAGRDPGELFAKESFPDAINAVFPQTIVQTCIVYLIRHSLECVSWKDRKLVVPALRAIYRAKDAETSSGFSLMTS